MTTVILTREIRVMKLKIAESLIGLSFAALTLPAHAVTLADFEGNWSGSGDRTVSIDINEDGSLGIIHSQPRGSDDFTVCETDGSYDPDRLRIYPGRKSRCTDYHFSADGDSEEKGKSERQEDFYFFLSDSGQLVKVETNCDSEKDCRISFERDAE